MERLFTHSSHYATNEGVKYAIQQCCYMDYLKNSDYQRIPAKAMATSLLQSLVRTRLYASAESSNHVFELLIQLLQHPSVSDSLVLPLLHMMKTYLATTPFPPVSLLSRISTVVTSYYIWPRPYSDAARDVLEIVAVEIRAPGTTLRTTLMEENPNFVPALPGSTSPEQAAATSSIPRERTVYMLFDKDIPRCKALLDNLKQHIPTQSSTVDIQLRFLASLFSACLKSKPDALGLEYATDEQIGLYYGAAVAVLEHCLSLSETQAIAHYTAELGALQKKILSEIGSVAHHKPAKPARLPPLNINTKIAPFTVASCVLDTGAHTRHHFPKRESYEYLQEVMVEAQEMVVAGEKPPLVKIGVVGGDFTIHNLTTGFLQLSCVRPELFDKVDVRFYFVPVENSDLAHWLATMDPWYGRQGIFLPRATIGLYPGSEGSSSSAASSTSTGFSSASSSSSTSTGGGASGRSMSMRLDAGALGAAFVDLLEEQSKLISPSTILHNELELLFREARYPIFLNIFRAECVTPDNTSMTLPFFSRASVGLSAAIEAFKKTNDLGSSLTESEITAHKNFKWTPPNIALKYIQMNPLSVARQIGQQDPRIYTSITLAALPVAGDSANYINPDPTNPWLELMLVEDKKKKTSAREEPRTYHCSQVELTGPEPFDLCLDGISYGLVSRVKFTAATHADKDAIYRLPFMTFLPTDGLH
jgi:hypothetical protein